MEYIDSKSLSPIGTDEFPCFGVHTSFHHEAKEPVPDYICLKVGTSHQCMMTVKLPYIDIIKYKKKILIDAIKNNYPVTVRFSGIRCYAYHFNKNSGFTGYANSFEIMED